MNSSYRFHCRKGEFVLIILALATVFVCDQGSWLHAQEPVNEDGVVDAQMAGYLLAPNERVPDDYDAGFSMYVAAWPLLDQYPGQRFQTGLFGTWMFPAIEKPEKKFYTDIEGGLGWWRDTRFATRTPKFIMGGVALNFNAWANGPGAGKGRDWEKPNGKYGVAQLSPWVLWPPDGLNLRQGTCGEWFGYGYLPLPLTDEKSTTAGKPVKTGNQCWTLFLNTANFKGPVAFFTPYFWSKDSVNSPQWDGLFLDSQRSSPNRQLQMETQYVPARVSSDSDGSQFARVAPVYYPANEDGTTSVVHRVMSYKRSAAWDSVQTWFQGGEPADTAIDQASAVIHKFTGKGAATWRIHEPGTAKEDRVLVDWNSFANPTAIDDQTFGYRWDRKWVTQLDAPEATNGSLVRLPEYYQRDSIVSTTSRWKPVASSTVPVATRLKQVEFNPAARPSIEPYVTPTETDSCWTSPGPVAGPFEARPGDGSVVTYHWYRFADQPAILNADLSDEEREVLQTRVEKLHRHWTKDREYLPAPRGGKLAYLDASLLVMPPAGFEIGYVPIATRQAIAP